MKNLPKLSGRFDVKSLKKDRVAFAESLVSTPTRTVEVWKHITRTMVRMNRDKTFLFGDNLERKGHGGQAKEMRGEWNCIGIPTKKKPTMHPDAFFTDDEFEANKRAIDDAFAEIPTRGTIVIPEAGIGTGLAALEHHAPTTFKYLQARLKQLAWY